MSLHLEAHRGALRVRFDRAIKLTMEPDGAMPG